VKISCPPFDIHKSKLVIAKWHFAKVGETYNWLDFSTKPNKYSREMFFGRKKKPWTQMHSKLF
jgi:hypothetical protein